MNLPVIPASLETLDNTSMSDFVRCPRLFNVKHRRGLRPKGTAIPLDFGKLLHTGLEVYYSTASIDAMLAALEDAPYEDPEDDHRTRGRAISTLTQYAEYWADPAGRRLDSWFSKIHVVEEPVEISDEQGFRWGGQIDLIPTWKGKLWVLDHKSTTSTRENWWNPWTLSPQMGGYSWIGQGLHGQEIAGIIINKLCVPAKDIPPAEAFQRQSYPYEPWKLTDWREQQIQNYKRIAECIERDSFPPNWYACRGQYGQMCSLFEACSSPPGKLRDLILEKDFEYNPWDWRDSGKGEEKK